MTAAFLQYDLCGTTAVVASQCNGGRQYYQLFLKSCMSIFVLCAIEDRREVWILHHVCLWCEPFTWCKCDMKVHTTSKNHQGYVWAADNRPSLTGFVFRDSDFSGIYAECLCPFLAEHNIPMNVSDNAQWRSCSLLFKADSFRLWLWKRENACHRTFILLHTEKKISVLLSPGPWVLPMS